MYKDVEGRKRIKEIRGLNADGRVEIEERGFFRSLDCSARVEKSIIR